MAIGERNADDSRYQFASIASILEGADGTLWVADGAGQGFTPMLRQFDSSGRFVRQVGRAGDGPGEYRIPQGLALLPDGRVALRDAGLPGRITVYRADGTLDAVWSLGSRFRWHLGGGTPIQVDTAGVIWLPVRGYVRPRPDRPPPFFLRVSTDGEVLDSVELPVVPDVERVRLEVRRRTRSGGLSIRGVYVPYQPSGIWAWSPSGGFVTARTDEYRIESSRGLVTRDVQPVPVGPDERDAIEERIRREIEDIEGGDELDVPEIPASKPFLRGLGFTEDGRLMVSVSIPSVLRDDEWDEPLAYDVFDADGRFMGRLVLDDPLFGADQMLRIHRNHAWVVHRDADGVQTVRRYRIEWP